MKKLFWIVLLLVAVGAGGAVFYANRGDKEPQVTTLKVTRGDIVDEGGHFREGYALEPGNWVLIRPDGYVGAIVASDERSVLDGYLENVGLAAAADRETQ